MVTIPLERLDLNIPEDIAEEVGRLYGYEKISPQELKIESNIEINPEVCVSSLISRTLIQNDFSQIFTYVFTSSGEVEIENPLATDKKSLRSNLSLAMEHSLLRNFKFVDLLGVKELKLFEIGKIFLERGESLHLSLGVKFPKREKSEDEEVAKMIDLVEKLIGISFGDVSIVGGVAEIDLSKIIKKVEIPEKYPGNFWDAGEKGEIIYKTISPYPFAVRDVAVFVPNDFGVEKVTELITKYLTDIVVRFSLFDTFTKGDKTSYAFRLVFQSQKKTLTDEEINIVMDVIYKALKSESEFEIR